MIWKLLIHTIKSCTKNTGHWIIQSCGRIQEDRKRGHMTKDIVDFQKERGGGGEGQMPSFIPRIPQSSSSWDWTEILAHKARLYSGIKLHDPNKVSVCHPWINRNITFTDILLCISLKPLNLSSHLWSKQIHVLPGHLPLKHKARLLFCQVKSYMYK